MHSKVKSVRIAAAAVLAAAALAQTGENLVMKSSVREVLLDVVVRDKHGKPVTDLKSDQLTVYEDGVRQNVRSFRLVKGSEVRAEDVKEAAEAASSNAAPSSARSGSRLNPLRTVNLVCLIFGSLDPDTRAAALKAAQEFVNNELGPNTYVGVFGFDMGDNLRPIYPFSNNREQLLKAVGRAAMNQLRPLSGNGAAGIAAAVTGAEMALMLNSGGPFGPNVSSDTLARMVVDSSGQAIGGGAAMDADDNTPLGPRGAMELDALDGLRALDALMGLTRQLAPLPFQKTVLLIGAGISRPPDQMGYWRTFLRAANQGGVTFYALDPWGLGVCQDESDVDCLSSSTPLRQTVDVLNKAASLSQTQQQVNSGSLSNRQNSELMHGDDYVHYAVLAANGQAGLRDLAESTGGFLIANTNNTEKLMKRVMEDVDTHYEVTYQPSAAGYDGRFREVEVKLGRADWQARTRSGYFALPESSEGRLGAGEMAGLKALDSSTRPHSFDYNAQALRFASGDGAAQFAVVFNVPIANLTATPEPATNSHRYRVSLLALARNAKGQVEDWFSRDVPSQVADKYMPGLQRRQMIWEHTFHLATGHYTIETAVVDEEGNRASTGSLEVNSVASSAPDLSDIMLAQEVKDLERVMDQSDPFEADGRRVLPLATGAVPAGTNPFLYFVLYPGEQSAQKARLHVEFFRDGKEIARRSVAVGPPDPNGRVPMLISAVQGPGNYQVRVAISEGGISVARSLRYSIAGN